MPELKNSQKIDPPLLEALRRAPEGDLLTVVLLLDTGTEPPESTVRLADFSSRSAWQQAVARAALERIKTAVSGTLDGLRALGLDPQGWELGQVIVSGTSAALAAAVDLPGVAFAVLDWELGLLDSLEAPLSEDEEVPGRGDEAEAELAPVAEKLEPVLEKLVWEAPDDQLRAWVSALLAELQHSGVALGNLLAVAEDATLVRAIQRDIVASEAFSELMAHRYAPILQRWFRRAGVQHHDVNDLVANVTANFFRSRFAGCDPTRPFGPYIWAYARHRLQDTARKRRPESRNHLEKRPGPEDVEADVQLHELETQIEQAISDLPVGLGEVMQRSFRGERRHEIAAALALTPGEVSRRLCRARRLLADSLRVTLPPDSRGRRPKMEDPSES